MAFSNIMVEVRRTYDLCPMLMPIVSQETVQHKEGKYVSRYRDKGVENSIKEVPFKASNFNNSMVLVIPGF
jgi:hypothetical protein